MIRAGAPRRWRYGVSGLALLSVALAAPSDLSAQASAPEAPAATASDNDPILLLGRETGDAAQFREAIQRSVRMAGDVGEAAAMTREADAVRTQARSALFPRVTLSLTSNQSIARKFSGSVDTVVEQSMAQRRSDANVQADQLVSDFGARDARIHASSLRLEAAAQATDDTATRVALQGIAAWYDVVGYRAAVALTQESVARQTRLRGDVQQRIDSGYLAQGDMARAERYLAGAQARLARYQRLLAGAEARFSQLFDTQPSATIGRAPAPGVPVESISAAQAAADKVPAVRSAQANADAARQDARAAGADRLPNLGVSLSAGRFGVLEHRDDYSVSARATLRMRLQAGFNAVYRQASARADAAQSRADQLRDEAERDATIAWTDVAALRDELAAMDANYRAARQSRDVLAERFRVSRGTLFDLLESEESSTSAAEGYVQTLIELDSARYALLARTGRLLAAFGIAPTSESPLR